MKRKAIIIGSLLSERNPKHLRGVSLDVNNFIKFFTSSVGGRWHRSEIITLVNPSRLQLLQAMKACEGADLAITVFSGHGGRDGIDYIQINDYDTIALSAINVIAKKQIIISDACRSQPVLEHFEGLSGVGWSFNHKNKQVARSLYDYFISTLEDGTFILNSCAPGENSRDTNQGGLFSTTILDIVESWSTSDKEIHFSLEKAYRQTHTRLAPTQHPAASTTADGMKNFPLALNPEAYLKLINVGKNQPTFGEVAAVVTFGLLAGCLLAAVVD